MDWTYCLPSALTPYAGRYGTGLPYHNDTGPMDKRIDKFIFCVCHTRKTVQASGSPMFFLLLRPPPTLGDHTDGVCASFARAFVPNSRGAGRTVGMRTSAWRRGRRRGSVATGAGRPWPVGRSRTRQVAPAWHRPELSRRTADREDAR